MSTFRQDSQFAWWALCIAFALGGWIFFLKIAVHARLITDLTEGLLRLVPGIVSLAALWWCTRQYGVSNAIRNTFIVFAVSLTGDLFLSLSEDVPAWNDYALLGGNSQARAVIEKFFSCIWFGASFFLIFLMVRSLERKSRELERVLADLQSAQEQNIRRERLSALGEMASGIAHDLNNTLAPVVSYTESVLADPQLTNGQRERCGCVLQAANDAASVIRRLEYFYRGGGESAPLELVQLKDLVSEIPNLTRPKWRDEALLQGRDILVRLDVDDVPPLLANPAELRTVLTNLVFNAIDAMPAGGEITLRLFEDDGKAVIEVIDDGVGMTEEQRTHCFEPFYSTKELKSGLGLSVCHGIIRQHRGTINVEPAGDGGTMMRISLPLPASSETEFPIAADSQPERFAFRGLYIEDDEMVRDALATLLRTLGGEIDLASDGRAGLQLLAAADYDIVFTDLGMQSMDGVAVVDTIKQQIGNLPVVVMSGWPRQEVLDSFAGHVQPDEIIEKPATAADIRRTLNRLLPVGLK